MPRHQHKFRLSALILTLIALSLACNFPTAGGGSNPEATIEAVRLTALAERAASQAAATATAPSQVRPDATPAAPPTPYPADPGAFYDYEARWGDSLEGLAGRFNVEAAQISSDQALPLQGLLSPGQHLRIPNSLERTTPAEILLPDSELIFSPAAADFDLSNFIIAAGGYLSTHRETLRDGASLDGPGIVGRVAAELSVNPRLLLALIEIRSGWLFDHPPGAENLQYPLGFQIAGRAGLYEELKIAATQLNLAYYGWRAGSFTDVRFPDGQQARLHPTLNAGTVALLHLFAYFSGPERWSENLYLTDGFPTNYSLWFGDPWTRAAAVEPLRGPDLAQPALALPFAPGERWSLTAGPHEAWNYGTPRGALDFAPIIGGLAPCALSPAWVSASAPGLVARAAFNSVALDLDGDGSEATGWVLVYLHLAGQDLIAPGARVELDQRLGHPSCEGGRSTGTHLHLARKYNGEWLPADGSPAFELSGWRAYADEGNYQGGLFLGSQTVSSNPSGRSGSTIVR